MGKFIFLLLFSFTASGVQSQTKYGIEKIQAFYAQRLPGIIPFDKEGNSWYKGPDTLYTIYIETNGKEIKWKKARSKSKEYSINKVLITEIPFEAGIGKKSGKKIMITASAGNELYQLQLATSENKKGSSATLKPGQVILEGIYNGKKITLRIDKPIELSLPDSV